MTDLFLWLLDRMTDALSVASAFLMHTGSRHLTFDLTSAQKAILAHPISKVVIMFAMFYVSTRSAGWSITLLLVYFLAVNMLFNENHALNVYSPGWLVEKGFVEKYSEDPNYTQMYRDNLQAISRT